MKRKNRKNLPKYKRNPMTILFIVAAPAVISFMGMAADMGVMYYNSARLQKVTNQAAVVGARSLPGDPDRAVDAVLEYAGHNGLDSKAVSVEVTKDDLHITVATEKNAPCYFGRMFGLPSQKMMAEATASNQAFAKVAQRANKPGVGF